MKLILLLVNFCVTIRVVYVILLFMSYFSYLWLDQAWVDTSVLVLYVVMIEYFDTGPEWVCVKVDDYRDPSFAGTLTHVNSLENICWACFCHRLHVACNSGLLFLFCEDE
jgi:hypothetical protein